jgi:signal transduction histidine kinase
VANLAHELRTPVQVLLGYVDILRDDHAPEFSTETHALLDRMNANIHDLAQTVDNLMHFVLSEVNAEAMIDEDVTPASLVAEIAPVLEAANQQKSQARARFRRRARSVLRSTATTQGDPPQPRR